MCLCFIGDASRPPPSPPSDPSDLSPCSITTTRTRTRMTKNKGTNLFVFRPFSLFLFFKYSPFPSSTCFVLLLQTENQQTLCVPVLQSGSRSPLPCESPTWCSQSVRDPVLHFDTLPPSLEDGADAPKVQVPAGPRALLSQRCSPERRLDLNREIIPQRAVPSSVHPSKNDRSVPPAPPPPPSQVDDR